MSTPAYLLLENGTVLEGSSFGAAGEALGEVVFTTGMTGYLETLTDPSYCGQIVMQTFPLIGNYGVIHGDFESAIPWPRGYIVNEWCHAPSNFRSEGALDTFLKGHGVVGLCGIDTRALTKQIRETGVMNAKIITQKENLGWHLKEVQGYRVKNAVEEAGSGEIRTYRPDRKKHTVVLWDFGAKENIIRELVGRNCEVIRMPAATPAAEILALKPDGVMLSNGPGDPADNTGIIGELAKLCQSKTPLFGICLGHQLLALARGGKTAKLHYGHRGANQPVKDRETGRVYITSQNHGYAVEEKTMPDCARVRFHNANDGTCEGVNYTDIPAFSVQFHPEGCGGPMDTRFLFDRFLALMDTE